MHISALLIPIVGTIPLNTISAENSAALSALSSSSESTMKFPVLYLTSSANEISLIGTAFAAPIDEETF